ncbi:MAG: redoxin domain-containing protein [Deltaproteobacteria bacterium]|nr:MAG: redoxin domain-containing protein [Deltaproteobacteria bacterium]
MVLRRVPARRRAAARRGGRASGRGARFRLAEAAADRGPRRHGALAGGRRVTETTSARPIVAGKIGATLLCCYLLAVALRIGGCYRAEAGVRDDRPDTGPRVGEPFPSFTLPDLSGTRVALGDFAGRPAVLLFVPSLDWSAPTKARVLDLADAIGGGPDARRHSDVGGGDAAEPPLRPRAHDSRVLSRRRGRCDRAARHRGGGSRKHAGRAPRDVRPRRRRSGGAARRAARPARVAGPRRDSRRGWIVALPLIG